jgi:hypothetical protein
MGAAHLEVVTDLSEALSVSADEHQISAIGGEAFRGFLSDRRGGAEDEDFQLVACSPETRRQKLDEKRGSTYFENSCQRGKLAWKVLGAIRASFAG